MNLLPTLTRRRALSRWDPFQDMREMQDELNRIFRPAGNGAETEAEIWAPSMDVVENGKSITLKLEVPGIDKKDIKVEVEDGVVTVSGERKIEKEEKKEDYTRIERSYGSFVRSFTLPDYADARNIAAETKDGVLKLVIPKIPVAKPEPKRIEVK
ncbi:Hsp20/alpha crystallin family protein [Candidatus Sumerlaeota bacterium]|nr:Hsp20/alpha crystallin family protein [Candidatus Sumerlaeota bacterium]MBI3736443.1 Hsp20/alpha crystallin family protein [Candidatus Sumerlaeota bacterium]